MLNKMQLNEMIFAGCILKRKKLYLIKKNFRTDLPPLSSGDNFLVEWNEKEINSVCCGLKIMVMILKKWWQYYPKYIKD